MDFNRTTNRRILQQKHHLPYSGEQSRLRRLALKEQEPLLALLGGETPRSSDRIGQQKLARAMPHSAFAATHAVQATRCRTSHPLPSLRGFNASERRSHPQDTTRSNCIVHACPTQSTLMGVLASYTTSTCGILPSGPTWTWKSCSPAIHNHVLVSRRYMRACPRQFRVGRCHST
jgi:hypothetical protein